MTVFPSTIAIDGPAAAGKTTLARNLAESLDYLYFDTGLMYRAVAYAVLARRVQVTDEAKVSEIAEELSIDILPADERQKQTLVTIDGENVTSLLRTAEVDAHVSAVSVYRRVRTAMTEQQRRIAARGRIVVVGRDIGTVVLPEAELKLYVDATLEERARRRFDEYRAAGRSESYDAILTAMRIRDEIDSRREVAPLKPASDAIVINTTGRDVEEVLAECLRIVALRSGHQQVNG